MQTTSQKAIEISVVVPCYNQEAYIGETLDSVLAQTYTNYEIVVVNDGSRDASLSIIQRYAAAHPEKIVVIDQPNQGVVASRNNAIRAARGKYIYPLDGDDKIHPECLEKLYAAMQAGKGDVIYSQTEFFGNKNGLFKLPLPTRFNMVRQNCVVCSALYRKTDWERYGGYSPDFAFNWEDWAFWLNFIDKGQRFYRIDAPLFLYRQVDNTRNITKGNEATLEHAFKLVKQKFPRLYYLYYLPQIIAKKFERFARFVYFRCVTSRGRIIIRIFRIPVYYGWDKTASCNKTHPKN